MNRSMKVAALLLGGILAISNSASAGVIVDKAPDIGPYWFPLAGGPPGGTYVYANSFVFTGSTGTLMDTVGVYMLSSSGSPASFFRFEVYADNSNTPTGALLGSTAYMQAGNALVALVTNTLGAAISLTNGDRYWIAASTAGQANLGSYQVGGHTPNSGPYDSAGDSFWYTNDPAGSFIEDPLNPGNVAGPLSPEMGIYASARDVPPPTGVPEPGSLAIWGLGFAACIAGFRRRKVAA